MPADPKLAHVAQELAAEAPLIACRFDPTGKYVFATSLNRSIYRWELAGGKRTVLAGHDSWAFDLAVTRFSGRPAPPHPGGVPHLPDRVAREAYSHEVSSAGFWPGGPALPEPIIYSYAYPEPEGFKEARVGPEAAYYNNDFKEFVLPYEAVRTSEDPDAALLQFLQTTYEAAATHAHWDRASLER